MECQACRADCFLADAACASRPSSLSRESRVTLFPETIINPSSINFRKARENASQLMFSIEAINSLAAGKVIVLSNGCLSVGKLKRKHATREMEESVA